MTNSVANIRISQIDCERQGKSIYGDADIFPDKIWELYPPFGSLTYYNTAAYMC